MKSTLGVRGLDGWLEQLANASESIDEDVAEVLQDAAPVVEAELERNLRKTSEEWTGETAETIEVSEVQREGNYSFIEATAGGPDARQAWWKEWGRDRQAAEPFFRPTFRGQKLKSEIKDGMKGLLEKYGVLK
jgi:HK97 gp10 family phage protein